MRLQLACVNSIVCPPSGIECSQRSLVCSGRRATTLEFATSAKPPTRRPVQLRHRLRAAVRGAVASRRNQPPNRRSRKTPKVGRAFRTGSSLSSVSVPVLTQSSGWLCPCVSLEVRAWVPRVLRKIFTIRSGGSPQVPFGAFILVVLRPYIVFREGGDRPGR